MANSIRARRLLKPSATRPDIRLQPIYVLPNHEISLAKPGGVHISSLSSQNIDFQDHLDGALNNLRFSERVWESTFFAKSGFYTNRIPAVTMHGMFKTAGFEIKQEAFGQWSLLPTPHISMHADFQGYQDEDLINCTSHVLLKA